MVAIDGPAGAGKSTLARSLARTLQTAYLNTGLMYRAVAAAALRRGVDPDDEKRLAALARELRFSMGDGEPPSLLIDGAEPPGDLTAGPVEAIVSRVSRHPRVRAVLRDAQRRLGEEGGVIEGRDIGTVVFPDADVKVFLRAAPSERAARRLAERGGDDPALAGALERRDELDNATNPLDPAPDAHVVDTTGRGPDVVLDVVLQLVRGAGERPSA